MGGSDGVAAIEVCDGPGHLEDPVVRPSRQPESVQGPLKQAGDVGGGATVAADIGQTHLTVGEDPRRVAQALDLTVTGLGDPLANDGAPLTRPILEQLPERYRRDLNVKVDSIEKWTRDPRSIAEYVHRITSAPPRVVSKPATGTLLRCLFAMPL